MVPEGPFLFTGAQNYTASLQGFYEFCILLLIAKLRYTLQKSTN